MAKRNLLETVQDIFFDWKGEEYRYPGEGALDYTKQITQGLNKGEAAQVIEALLAGEIHDRTDKRIKRCQWCRYYYRDKTKPNNSKTCSLACKTARDTKDRARKEVDRRLLHGIPKRLLKREEFYNADLGIWTSEPEMISYYRSREGGGSGNVEAIIDARQVAELMGGKRKVTRGDYY